MLYLSALGREIEIRRLVSLFESQGKDTSAFIFLTICLHTTTLNFAGITANELQITGDHISCFSNSLSHALQLLFLPAQTLPCTILRAIPSNQQQKTDRKTNAECARCYYPLPFPVKARQSLRKSSVIRAYPPIFRHRWLQGIDPQSLQTSTPPAALFKTASLQTCRNRHCALSAHLHSFPVQP